MPVASLTNFTVPLPPGATNSGSGLLMPKLKYRFRATFINFGVTNPTTELTKQVADIKRPQVNFNPFTVDVYNSKVHLQGKPEWQDTMIHLRDDATGKVSQLVGEQLQKQFDFFEQSSAASGIDYKFTTVIEILDGGNGANAPQVLETFELYGCFVQGANYNSLNYQENTPVSITLNIRFDNAIQTPQGVGIGKELGRTLGTLATGSGI